jgi:hypothetical protein
MPISTNNPFAPIALTNGHVNADLCVDLEQPGTVLNAANDLAVSGLNSNNLSDFNTVFQPVATGVHNIRLYHS